MTDPRIAVRDTKAAQMLDLPAAEFRRLVDSGALPKPRNLAGHDRWLVRDLEAVLNGDAAWPDAEDIEL